MALETGIQAVAPNELMRSFHSFLDATSVTSSSAMNPFLVGNMTGMVVMVKAVSSAGTPNFTLSLQTSFEDVSATYTDVDAISRPNFAAINDEVWHVYTVNFVNCMQYARFYITLNGGDGGDDVFYFKACPLYGSLTHATDVTIEAGSISIGSIKLEDGATTNKAIVNDANTGRAATDHVLLVQALDASGNVVATDKLTTGSTPFVDLSVDNSAQTMKGTAGTLHFLQVTNPNATESWLQVFNNAAPTIGVTVPTLSFWIPANGAYSVAIPTQGIAFSTAITYAATTTSSGGVATASVLQLNAAYK